MKDAIVDAVHRRREQRSAQFKHDIDAMFEDLRRSEAKSRALGAKFVSPRRRKNSGGPWPIVSREEDPIVAEVRRYREAHAAKFNYNIRAIAEDARKRQATSGHPVVDLSREGTRKRQKATVSRAHGRKRTA